MTLHEYNCKVSELLDNALNDLTPKDFDNLLVVILSMLLDYNDEDNEVREL